MHFIFQIRPVKALYKPKKRNVGNQKVFSPILLFSLNVPQVSWVSVQKCWFLSEISEGMSVGTDRWWGRVVGFDGARN